MSYVGGGFTTAEITAIGAGWADQKRVRVWALGEVDTREMLVGFRELWDQADIVTGHYIRKHDLPLLSGAMLEADLPPLTPKLTTDTYFDLVKRKDLSASQEALSAMYGLSRPKHSMNQTQWREANRLTKAGVKYTKQRVRADVHQHKQLRERLIEARVLKPPKMWYPK